MASAPKKSIQFTHKWLNEIRCSNREVWHDAGCKGLIVRIGTGATQSRVFYWYGRAAGKPTFIKIGEYPAVTVTAARDEARSLSGQIAIGNKGKTRFAITRDEWTLGMLFSWYMKTHAKPHKRTWVDDERRYNLRLSQWSNWKLSAITKPIVKAHHVFISDKSHFKKPREGGNYAANKMLELLGFMYRLGKQELGITADDPTDGIKRFQRIERDRYLNYDELPRFLAAVDELQHATTRDYIYCALLIGARRNNLAAMRWCDIDFDLKSWRVDGEDSKNKNAMRIVLPPDAIEILKKRQLESRSQWVFPGSGKTGHIVDPRTAMRVALFKAGITNHKSKKDAYNGTVATENHVRFHDLRRTLGSWQATHGTSLLVIAKTLGHKSQSAVRVYARMDMEPARESVNAVTAAMLAAKNNSKKTSK